MLRQVRWWWRRLSVFHVVPAHSALFHRIVRRHGEKRCGRLHTLNIRQRVSGFAKSRIAPLAVHNGLKLRRTPYLGNNADGLIIANFTSRNCAGGALTTHHKAFHRLRSEVFLADLGFFIDHQASLHGHLRWRKRNVRRHWISHLHEKHFRSARPTRRARYRSSALRQ